ncbi:MAG: biosynthetic arginine decarboxylase [Blastocatellia bacterium]|nr:biosynthetic arginine decarboxylase [Blastocatellia bacterium]
MKAKLEEVAQTYGIENWGAGYFDINQKGHLIVRPAPGDRRNVDVKEIIEDLSRRNIKSPILLRFPQILANQVRRISTAFQNAIKEFDYQGKYLGVFPMKVNPRREVVEEFLRSGKRYDFGVEVGSKPELYSALALEQSSASLLICNGFKDEGYIRMAFMGTQIGKKVVIVVEKLGELQTIIRLIQETGVRPMIGIRVKLYSRGSGKWETSGGETAKFGLTASEILEVIRLLRENDLLDQLKLLHFHIGSQITNIKRIKNAMKEAARVYCKIRAMHIGVEYLDVGGGMGVDYDGSKTSSDSSANYGPQEFANDIIYTIKGVCEDEDMPEPNIITESGRALSAYHCLLITNIQEEIETVVGEYEAVKVDDDDPQVIVELKDLCEGITSKNYVEYYHDALEHKDELFTLFNLGIISLEDRAKGEILFWEVCERTVKFAQHQYGRQMIDEYEELRQLLSAKYLCNFSVFRSVPDSWAIEQLFPIMPIHKLHQRPTEHATLVDITCDSDGIIDKFVDLKDVKETLELHPFKGEPYYLGIFLVGAYQEVMGNGHNLFGAVHEAHIVIQDGSYLVTKVVPGSNLGDAVATARYDRAFLHEGFGRLAAEQVKQGSLSPTQAENLCREYENNITYYTYLG